MEIRAPLSGLIVPLDTVPDELFARKIMGDGVAIDPTSSEVLAPIAGRVTQLHRANHALAITDETGVEILIHVGIDTVKLSGQGFTPLVAPGTHVECGQPLLRFDADRIACAGYSLLTPVIVTSGDRVANLQRAQGLAEAGRTALISFELRDAKASVVAARSEQHDSLTSDAIKLPNPEGLHARPAAALAEHARKFTADIRLRRGDEIVNAKSVVAIMGLSTRIGDLVRIEANGADAVTAVAELSRLIADGCGERAGAMPSSAASAARAVTARDQLAGIASSPGLAIGRVYQYRRSAFTFDENATGATTERAQLADALHTAALQLSALERGIEDRAHTQILAVHRALLEDPELLELTEAALARGKSAAFAWNQACSTYAAKFERLEVPLLRERAADVRDVGRRVLARLTGAKVERVTLPNESVVIAEELAPSELAAFERDKLAGLCTTTGGSTSHVAILARSIGIPAICGIDAAALALPEGSNVVLDGNLGVLQMNPDEVALSKVRERMVRDAQQRAADRATSKALAHTRDGQRIEIVANIRNLDDAYAALDEGAEGVGLLRTEMLFARDTPPSEDEQAATYSAIAQALSKDRPLIVRTLDAGGDKPIPYLSLPKENNPFLGLRGIRVSLHRPDVFRVQLRAILRAAATGNVHIMFPMVAGLEEVRAARKILAEEQRTLPDVGAVKVGIMIEVPSAAMLSEALAREVDFFSIGTNDLTQYTLAMDRGHPLLARQADALHPAVLRMIATTVEGARKHDRWVGVCGGIASDPLAVPVLIGLGVSELSVDARAIAPVKSAVARFMLAECQAIATEALTLATTAEVRTLLSARAAARGAS